MKQVEGRVCSMLMYFRFRIAHFSANNRGYWLLLALALQSSAHAQSFELSTDDWVRPRNGQSVSEFKALQQAVAAWSADGGEGTIEIRYPGGEEGSLWARELTDWLVAFGVPSRHIQAAAGSAGRDRIVLNVIESEKTTK
jgi:hypothetical protein